MTTKEELSQLDYMEMDEIGWLNRIQRNPIQLILELLHEHEDCYGYPISEEKAILILTIIKPIFEQVHRTKIDNLEDYKRFKYWAYWTYGLVIYGTNNFCGNDPQLVEVTIMPRMIFNAIKYGGLTDEELKKQFPKMKECFLPKNLFRKVQEPAEPEK